MSEKPTEYTPPPETGRAMFVTGRGKPGVNLDRIDVAAGLRELRACDYDDAHTVMVIEHALMRWARGEEHAAEKGAIDKTFYGVNLTSWRRVLAAARADGEANAPSSKRQRP